MGTYPFFMSPKFSYLRSIEGVKEAFQALKEHGDEELIEFFLDSVEDKTWIVDWGGQLLGLILGHLSEKFRKRLLPLPLAEKIVHGVWKHSRSWKDHIPNDMELMSGRVIVHGNSLLFGVASEYFRERIYHAEKEVRRPLRIETSRLDPQFYLFLREYVYTGQIENLWKEEAKTILELIRYAGKVVMPGLSAFASGVFKRYLTPENVVKVLKIAVREFLKELEKECCEYLNKLQYGIDLSSETGAGLRVKLFHLSDEGVELIKGMISQIAYFEIGPQAAADPATPSLLSRLRSLTLLSFAGSDQIAEGLIEALPTAKHLDLSDCRWLKDVSFLQIISRMPGLVSLNLAKDGGLTYRAWGALSGLRELSKLDLSYCRSMNDDDFDLMAAGITGMAELNLSGTEVSDFALERIAKQCPGLAILNLKDCPNITVKGILSLGGPNSRIVSLDLSGNKSLKDEEMRRIKEAFPNLQNM